MLWRTLLDGVLVLAPRLDSPQLVTPPGDVVWQLLEGETTLDDLIARLARQFNSDAPVVRADVEPLLATLIAGGVVLVIPPDDDHELGERRAPPASPDGDAAQDR